jgi:hypothetical protein
MLCETCIYAEWEMTKHKKPKINKKKPGVCKYKINGIDIFNVLNNILPKISLYHNRDIQETTYIFKKVNTLWSDYEINECSQYIKKVND